MKRISMYAVVLAAAVSLAACGQDATDERARMADEPRPEMAPMGRTDEAADRNFIQQAAEKHLTEIELSKIAQERAQNPQVRELAQTMVQDHMKALDELRQIAERENVQIAEQLPEEQREKRDQLQTMKGPEFDREYMNAMVEGHREMQDLLQDRADRDADRFGADRDRGPVGTVGQPEAEGELNQWASRTLPTVQRHHERAEQLQEKLAEGRQTR